MSSHTPDNAQKDSFWIKPITLAASVFLAWLACPMVLAYLMRVGRISSDWQDLGQLGDTFGAVNSLFTGLAFAGAIYALTQQRKELHLQRLQLKLQQEELVRSNAQFELQNKIMDAQYQLLKQEREEAKRTGFLAHLPGFWLDMNSQGQTLFSVHIGNGGNSVRDV